MYIAGMTLRAAIALCGLTLLAGCSSGEGANTTDSRPKDAVPVSVVAAVRKDVPMRLLAIGNVQAFSTVSIKAQVEGQVAHVEFEEGQRVKKDDLLFTIDERPFAAALREAEANLARDLAELSNAEVEAKRRASLLAGGFVSRDEHDQAQTKAASLRGVVKADEAAVETAKLRLQYCYIRSPIDGKTGQILVHEGNVVKANETTLAVVNQTPPVYVAFSVPEQTLPEIRRRAAAEKLTVEASFAGDAGRPASGELQFIDNAVDASTGTVVLKGLFTNDDERLWPGQFVQVAMTLAVQRDAVVVPAEAIQTGQQGQFVFVVGADLTAQVRPVTVGQADGSATVITTGLEAGERVVTEGQIRLAPGIKVQLKDFTGKESAPAGSSGQS